MKLWKRILAALAVIGILATTGAGIFYGAASSHAAPQQRHPVATASYGTYGWAGYAWRTRSNTVTTTLRLPHVYPARNAGAAFWAGFGRGPGIEQTGFTANMVNGHLNWTGWYQMYPSGAAGFGHAAHSGDYVSMTVTYRGRGWFRLTLHDATRRWYASTVRHAPRTTLNTSEVIVEAFGPPLPHFSAAHFYSTSSRSGWAYRMPGVHVSPLWRGHFYVYR